MQSAVADLPTGAVTEMRFGEKLAALREVAKLSQARLALASGISVRVLQSYEQGHREPTLGYAIRLAQALGVTVAEFSDCDFQKDETKKQPTPKRKRPGK